MTSDGPKPLDSLLLLRVVLDAAIAGTGRVRDDQEDGPRAPDVPPFLSVTDFAVRIGVTEKAVRQMIADGMPHVRPRPRLTRVAVPQAERWMAERSHPAAPSASIEAARRRATLDAHRGDPH
jgi:hypothetical protein